MDIKRLKRSLRRVVGPNAIVDDPASRAVYSYDSSLQTATPDLILFPRTTAQVAEIVVLLNREGVPFVARGAGTNLSGGSIPVAGGAVIALSHMKKIIDISPENLCTRIEPGVTNLALQDALKKEGYFFAPDPASQKVSTVGGNVAENSGGPRCLKYGVTTNHILGLKVVTPRGEIIELGGGTLECPGYDMLGLFVGSEGTLGIATEITCRIMPLPQSTRTMLAVYDSNENAGQTVSEIIAAGILPAALEMMDTLIIRAVEEAYHAGYPTDAAAVLIIEIDGWSEGLSKTAEEIERICLGNGARDVRTARDAKERDQLWAGRRGAFGAVARLFPNYSVSDGTVPRARLPEVLRRINDIGCKYDLDIGNVFHAGDGNLHPLLFFDIRDNDQVDRVHRASKEILETCVDAGGTITGEHGVGTEKIHAMPLTFGPGEVDLMRKIKSGLDPLNLCNPGKILPNELLEDKQSLPPKDGRTAPPAAGEYRGIPVYSPTDPAELAAVVGFLQRAGKSMTAIGGLTLFPYLPSCRLSDAFIDTKGMCSVVEHDAANLSVTVEAGLSIGELQEYLSGAGQFLPLDAPKSATAGGIAASALSGPRRHSYGATRDMILGVTFVDAQGRMLKAGGKTMKNVAGYDFGKLLIGSWGKLGIISTLTFRLLPVPKESGAVVAVFKEAEDAYAAARLLMDSQTWPELITLISAGETNRLADGVKGVVQPGCYTLAVGVEGFPPAVEERLGEIERICKSASATISNRPIGIEYRGLISTLTCLPYPAADSNATLSVRISAPRKESIEVFKSTTELAGNCGTGWDGIAHLSSGLLYGHFIPTDTVQPAESGKKLVKALENGSAHSTTTVLGACPALKDTLPFVINGRIHAPWLRSIERCFDPNGLLNPGLPQW